MDEAQRAIVARADALREIRDKAGFAELERYLREKVDQLPRELVRRESVSDVQLAECRGAVRALEAVIEDVDALIAAGDELREDARELREMTQRLATGSGDLAL
jgi:hypothetical protein